MCSLLYYSGFFSFHQYDFCILWDTRSLAEIKRRHVPKYTSMYILGLRVCAANSFLHVTTAIHGGTDTLSIFSSGTDAAGYIRSDVSAMLKLAAKSVQGCTLLARQRSRYTPPALLKIVIPDTRRRANNTRRRAFCTFRTVIRSATP